MRERAGAVVVAGLVVALVLAVVAGQLASSSPDGLDKIAAEHRLDTEAAEHPLAEGPLAGYGVAGVDDDRTGTGAVGAVGVVVTFTAAVGLVAVVRRARGGARPRSPAAVRAGR